MYNTRYKRAGLARKLAIAVIISLSASIIVTTGVSAWLDLRRQAALETERLTQTAHVIASLAAAAVAREDRAAAFIAVRSVSEMPNVQYARLESMNALLAETGAGARLLSDAQVGSQSGGLSLWQIMRTGSIQASVPVRFEGRDVGSMTLFSRTPDLAGRVLSTVWITLIGAVAAGAVGLALALRLANRTIRPVVDLAGIVRRLHESKDFSSPVNVRAEGEVAELVEGFEVLLSGIRERDILIARHVEGLEAEVAERTRDLVVARDAAEQANAAKSDFLAVMSHEIRTPLNGILALSEMLAQSDLPTRQQRYAGVIAKSGQSLLSIINDILDFSKVEAGKMDLETVEVDLVETAEDVASLFAAKARDKGLDLGVFVDPQLSFVMTDPGRLRQVISNLVNNAIKFTDTGGVQIAIEATDDGVRVAVIDTGPGIPADRLPSLFEAFTQADQTTTRKHGGTGLGLAICDRLVRSMGGTWDLSSTMGQGSTFAFVVPFETVASPAALPLFAGLSVRIEGLGAQTSEALRRYVEALGGCVDTAARSGFVSPNVTRPSLAVVFCMDEDEAADVRRLSEEACVVVLPVRRAEVLAVLEQMARGENPHLTEIAAEAAVVRRFPDARVLVVDDSDVNREVASEALGRLGVIVETAEDGLEAVERLRTKAYDLVLMDGSMPGLDGFEATRRIRAEERETGRPRAAIVALTAHVVGAGAQAWRESDMDGVIHKPFALADLARELGRHCAAHAVEGFATTPSIEVASAVDPAMFDATVRNELTAMSTSGRSEFVARIHALYLENAPARLSDLRTALGAGDLGAVARAAHALRSMSLSLGAAGVATAAQGIERDAEAGRVEGSEVERLADMLQATLAAFTDLATPAPAIRSLRETVVEAIASDELFLTYQPLVDRSGATVAKAEALVRWLHPVEGHKSPCDFVPRLEVEGGVEVLTDWVMARALSETADLGIRVSVNVSASEFQRPGFAARVGRALQAAGATPDRLEIEVTETAPLDVGAASRAITELQALGISVALDDFGAGYTSLHALRELRFNTLKVDRVFIEDCCTDTASAAIIHAVLGVGRALGMTVVCEGVESAEQAEFLRVAGAHLQQGYHFHRPSRASQLPFVRSRAA